MKQINFDMDGTLANFYGVDSWLDYLLDENPFPYVNATPLVDMTELGKELNRLRGRGYEINIISWSSKCGSPGFHEAIKKAKFDWLERMLPTFHFDAVYIIQYGYSKSIFGKGILFDDEKPNRDEWNGLAFDEKNILKILKSLD